MVKLKPKRQKAVQNRVVGLRKVLAGDLEAIQDHPLNWREHGDDQKRTMDDLLGEVGFIKPVDVYLPKPEDTFVTAGVMVGGQLVRLKAGVPCIMDGHLRRERLPADFELTLNVTDLDQSEALKYLATCDPLAGLAGQDDERLVEVLSMVDSDSAAVQKMLADIADIDTSTGEENDGDAPDGKFQILITCRDEDEQRALVEELIGRGVEHKALLA